MPIVVDGAASPPPPSPIGFDAVYPFVLPHVPTAPPDLIDVSILLAAQRFCKATHLWEEDLEPLESTLSTVYALPLPDGAAFLKLVSASTDTIEFALSDRRAGPGQAVRGIAVAYCPTETSIVVTPSPVVVGTGIAVRAALAPTLQSIQLPGVLAEYLDVIGQGALAHLFAMPKKDWTDRGAAEDERAQFEGHCSRQAARVSTGLVGKAPRAAVHWY